MPAQLAVKKMQVEKEEMSTPDLKMSAEIIAKCKETVLGKDIAPPVQINNSPDKQIVQIYIPDNGRD